LKDDRTKIKELFELTREQNEWFAR